MSKLKIIKIAKELNVGVSTLVDHLVDKGFEVENKPTAKISEEMHAELLKEFQKSYAIKEKADSLVIGTRLGSSGSGQDKAGNAPSAPVKEHPPAPENKEEKTKEETKPAVQEKAEAKQSKQDNNESEETPRKARGLKVLGKINLGSGKSEKKEEKPKTEPQEKATTPEPTAEPEKKDAPKEAAKPADEKPKVEEPKPEVPKEAKKEEVAEKPVEKATPKAEEPKPEPAAKKEAPEIAKEEKPEAPKADKQPEKKEQSEKEAAADKNAPAKKQEDEKPEEKPQKAPVAKQSPPEEKKAPSKSAQPKPEEVEGNATADKEDEKSTTRRSSVIKAEAPELRGLKIQGKIDLNKFDRPKKSKKKDDKKDDKNTDSNRSGANKSGSTDDGERRKRRRKRKKVSPPSGGGNNNRRQSQSGGGSRRRGRRKEDEPKEVSQKEIEEKIKATMARISGAGKKKRQKMRRDNRERLREKQEIREQEMENDKLQVTEFISVQELANLMDVPVTDVITVCMNLGVIVSINQRLDAEIIELVADEFDHEVEFISVEEQTDEEEEIIDDPEDLEPRAPIVTVMGHVDHGKTSLLDHIRQANVAEGEAGGITQHIGAYEVLVGENDKKITFLDTPGHEAFTAMRARGAKVTDVAIIIIAADDNIMPQTKEAISHAQAAEVPIVFAINKVDKPGAQPERIKQELASMNYLVEEWGGQYQSQDISAKTGQGIDELLEKIVLEAEVLELKANPNREASGVVIEASLDKGRGYVTKMLVQSGTLEIGDSTVAGEHSGKVKAMFNERGKRIKKAGPATPVLVLGLSGAPQAGERFKVVDSEQEARQIANKRMQIAREQANRATKRISLDEIGRRLALGNFKELNLIVKGDVDGSVEALSDSLIKQSIETVQVNVLHKAVGQIAESDVLLASASDAIIIGFQVRPSIGARKLAEREGVQIKMYSIIYEAIEEIRAAIEGMLEPTKEERITANLEVRNTFKISKVGTVAGCYVQEGKINRNSKIRLIRDGIVVYPTKEGQTAELASLKRFKDDVKEVKAGMECGLNIKNFNDIKVGDTIESYEIVEIKQTLD
jgi:translation initiation factor IF-2